MRYLYTKPALRDLFVIPNIKDLIMSGTLLERKENIDKYLMKNIWNGNLIISWRIRIMNEYKKLN